MFDHVENLAKIKEVRVLVTKFSTQLDSALAQEGETVEIPKDVLRVSRDVIKNLTRMLEQQAQYLADVHDALGERLID